MQSALHVQSDDDFDVLANAIQDHFTGVVAAYGKHLFTVNSGDLYATYLKNLPDGERQYHTCHCCRQFIERFGNLVAIDDSGNTIPAMWGDFDVSAIYSGSIKALAAQVASAQVTGVFLSSDSIFGTQEAGGWHHFCAVPSKDMIYRRGALTAGQAMAAKREDFGTVARALEEFSAAHVQLALNVLRSDHIYSSEKVIGPAQFLHQLHSDRAASKNSKTKANVLWLAVAVAPDGFCHPRSSMIGTLLEDIASGMDFDAVARRFKDKMHPLRYQRPQAAPSAGNVAQAEKLFEQLGLASALGRRIARFDEVPKLWETNDTQKTVPLVGGVFGHIKTKDAVSSPSDIDIPAITMTLQKFVQTVIPSAERIEVQIDSGRLPFIVVTTAENPEAPRLFQWDHPFAWYGWNGGAKASQYGLTTGWAKVSGITRLPARWNDDGERFTHHGDGLILMLAGAHETIVAGAALFPSFLRSDLHGVRSTLEAHSNGSGMGGLDDGTAIGYDLRSSGCKALVRVTSSSGTQAYKIDRWD